MSTKTAPVTALRVSRLIKAPRERVFAAWTTPEDIMKWFGPETCTVLSAKMDVKAGGKYSIRVNSKGCEGGEEMSEMEVKGSFREVKRPSRLVYTWAWQGDEEFPETVVTVDFLDKEGFTEVQLTHEGLPNAESREKHGHGWNGCLDKLERLVATSADGNGMCPEPGTFCWNELLAADPAGAGKFYAKLFGWKTEDMPGGMKYTIFKQGDKMVGGMMARPNPQAPPHWLAYVMVEDVDARAKQAGDLGAKILMPPTDIPTVGRIAVFLDPEGAPLGIFKPEKE